MDFLRFGVNIGAPGSLSAGITVFSFPLDLTMTDTKLHKVHSTALSLWTPGDSDVCIYILYLFSLVYLLYEPQREIRYGCQEKSNILLIYFYFQASNICHYVHSIIVVIQRENLSTSILFHRYITFKTDQEIMQFKFNQRNN